MLTREQVGTEVKSIICEITGLKADEITGKANFVDDLGIESVMAVDILATVEKKYQIKVPEEKIPEIGNLDGFVNVIIELAEKK